MPRPLLPVLLAPLLLAACSEELVDVPVTVSLTPGAAACAAALPPRPIAALNAAAVRLTVYRRPAPGKATLVCDRVVSAGGGSASLSLPGGGGDPLDLLLEVYDNQTPARLLAAGGATAINLKPRINSLRVLVSQAGRFSCAPGAMTVSRSFHSATALPNGEVLLIGGLTSQAPAGGAAGSEQLWATDTVEVYDPRSGLFRQSPRGLSLPRAMHAAVLLTSSGQGPYDVLLIGGLSTAAGSTRPAATLSGPMPVFPEAAVATAPSLVLRYYPWTSPPQVEQMGGSPLLKYRILPTLARGGGGEVVALGGLAGASAGAISTVDDFELLPTAGSSLHSGAFPLTQARLGAAAAQLSPTEILVFGGNLKASGGDLAGKAAELITLGASPRAAAAAFEPGSLALVTPVAHGTLTAYGQGQLLLAGGLTVQTGAARAVNTARPLMRLTRVGTLLRAAPLAAPGFAPVAYHSATPLPGGELLLSGGMPATCPKDRPCGSTAASSFLPRTEGLRAELPLHQPRMGHQATPLPDGLVLITGGLHHDGARLQTQATAELFAPSQVDPFGRPAGVATVTCAE